MRCPKCRLITYEGRKKCPRCGEDLSPLSETLGPFYEPNLPENLILRDTLLTPPSFIGTPEIPFSLENNLQEASEKLEIISGKGESQPKALEAVPPPEVEEFLKELEEIIEEENKEGKS